MAAHSRSRSGYTLIEMMVVVVLIGLVTMIALPSSAVALAHLQVNKASAVVRSDLELALALASRQHRPLRLEASGSTYLLLGRSGDTLLIRTFGAGRELGPVAVSFSSATVDIFPTGLASGPLIVTLSRDSFARTVTMSRSGQLRVAP